MQMYLHTLETDKKLGFHGRIKIYHPAEHNAIFFQLWSDQNLDL
jgi:hypothetical protein